MSPAIPRAGHPRIPRCRRHIDRSFPSGGALCLLAIALSHCVHAQRPRASAAAHRLSAVGLYSGSWPLPSGYRHALHAVGAEYARAWPLGGGFSVEGCVKSYAGAAYYRQTGVDAVSLYAAEAGVMPGFLLRLQPAQKRGSLAIGVLSGPLLLSKGVPRQHGGLVFASHFFLGIGIQRPGRVSHEWRAGFRHLSNAGLQEPNGGLNGVFLAIVLHREGGRGAPGKAGLRGPSPAASWGRAARPGWRAAP